MPRITFILKNDGQSKATIVDPPIGPVASTSTATAAEVTKRVEVPDFRLLSEAEQALGRLRPGKEEVDLSDAAFARRHRYPEVLEKRSKRRERDKLTHERFKVKQTIESLRSGRGIGNLINASALRHLKPIPGETEMEKKDRLRMQLLEETEQTLRRYDELLNTTVPRSAAPAFIPAQRALSPALTEGGAWTAKSRGAKDAKGKKLRATTPKPVPKAAPAPKLPPTFKPPPGTMPTKFTIPLVRLTDGTQSKGIQIATVSPQRFDEALSSPKPKRLAVEQDRPRPAKKPRKSTPPPPPLLDSFFRSEAVRKQIFQPPSAPDSNVAIRKSSRVNWAWGVRVPEALCEVKKDFNDTFDFHAHEILPPPPPTGVDGTADVAMEDAGPTCDGV